MEDLYISPLTQNYPTLYHYTNALGLQGIIESQQLHATDINYLNDAEEHIHFCEKRLPELLDRMWENSSESEQTSIFKKGHRSEAEFKKNMQSVFSKSIPDNHPFTVSFSIPREIDRDDGLLSQWRAYGHDGGFAIEFSTEGLVRKLQSKRERFNYPYYIFSPAYYCREDEPQEIFVEREVHERAFLTHLKDIVLTNNINNFPPLQEKLATLSILIKHRGFHEEQEFRMALLHPNPDIPAPEKAAPANPLRFRPGSLKPYIALFEEKMGLPIQRVIVGPHPDKEKRKAAVKALLRQNHINAEVITSTIPYLGT